MKDPAPTPPENSEDTDETAEEKPTSKRAKRSPLSRVLVGVGAVILVIVLVVAAYAGYVYAVSPAVIRHPKLEHYHLRLQILVNNHAEDFSSAAYQEGYSKDQCTAALPDHPFHFHDKKDQFVHVHWEGMTGGLLMKYYGWNYIGGPNDKLGYNLLKPTHPEAVPIHGRVLPDVPKDAQLYVYTGDEHGFKARSFDDWKQQDLEKFLGKTSNFPSHKINTQSSLLNLLVPKAYAHGTTDAGSGNESDEERLTRINNLLGNVVIFVQHDKPSETQVKARFDHLLPLDDSTCGG